MKMKNIIFYENLIEKLINQIYGSNANNIEAENTRLGLNNLN